MQPGRIRRHTHPRCTAQPAGGSRAGQWVSLVLLTAEKQKEQVAEYVAAGNTAQFGDPAWLKS